MPDLGDIRTLRSEDVPHVLLLAHAVGWTQTEVDIERMIAFAPEGCFGIDAAESGGRPGGLVATAMAFRYGTDLGWVAMVLTHPDWRGQGLGTRLTRHAVEYLRSLGIPWIKLDASDLGQPIYERLGFQVEHVMERRLRAPGPAPEALRRELPPVTEAGPLPFALDREAFGADRAALLRTLRELDDAQTGLLPEAGGYAILRSSKRGRQLGPMVCRDEAGAEALLRWAIERAPGITVQWDLMPPNQHAIALAEHYGFEVFRVLQRMSLAGIPDPQPFAGSNHLVYSIAGFDFG